MTTPSDRDKEIFLLSALFFYYKYVLHKRFWEILQDTRAQTDEEWAIGELHKLPKKDAHTSFFVEKIFGSEALLKCFEVLGQSDGETLLRSLDAMFLNQEFCAQCEAWSYYDAETAEEFALGTAQAMLALLSEAGRGLGVYTPVRVKWFEDIWRGQERYDILRNAVAELLTKIKGTPVSLPLLALSA